MSLAATLIGCGDSGKPHGTAPVNVRTPQEVQALADAAKKEELEKARIVKLYEENPQAAQDAAKKYGNDQITPK